MFTDAHRFFALRTNDPSNNMQEIRSIDQDWTFIGFYNPNLIRRWYTSFHRIVRCDHQVDIELLYFGQKLKILSWTSVIDADNGQKNVSIFFIPLWTGFGILVHGSNFVGKNDGSELSSEHWIDCGFDFHSFLFGDFLDFSGLLAHDVTAEFKYRFVFSSNVNNDFPLNSDAWIVFW